jgi:hypothetical protein
VQPSREKVFEAETLSDTCGLPARYTYRIAPYADDNGGLALVRIEGRKDACKCGE